MTSPSGVRWLHKLAYLYGVQTAYYDVSHYRQPTAVETQLSLLRSLGAPINSFNDVPTALRERQQALWQRTLEPVSVARESQPHRVNVRLPADAADYPLSCSLEMESGQWRHWQYHGADLPVVEVEDVEGIKYVGKQLPLPDGLPQGYHRLYLELPGNKNAESLIIAAPMRAYLPEAGTETRTWGAFIPLYALSSERSRGSGDYGDLERLADWVASLEGGVVATLPLLPTFTETPTNVSPYLPVSRRMWNEFYIDIDKVPELAECSEARAWLESSSFKREIKELQDAPLVDYPRQMGLKRLVLEKLCRSLFTGPSARRAALREFVAANPAVEDYARFRAAQEKRGVPLRLWPPPLQNGQLKEGDYDEDSRRYHLYAQWLAHQQIESLSEKIKSRGVQLYIDLPAGVHPDGYDVWRERGAFMKDVAAGAPPDAVFTGGQDWRFPPPHPENIREQGYRYVIDYLRHHLKHASILRIDHVMGLHRLFCIPRGMEADQGTYIRYRAEELYAILALESQRHKTVIVGEDLGTVPGYIRPAMNRHGLRRMYVLHYELISDKQKELPLVPPDTVASLNTHDMPPFAGFWQGDDIPQRYALGLLDEAGARQEELGRKNIRQVTVNSLRQQGWLNNTVTDTTGVTRGCLAYLAASRAPMVLVNLEDLWGETQPQNIPGTGDNYPNWRHKARYSFEEFRRMPGVIDTLRAVNEIREKTWVRKRNRRQ